MTDKLPVKDNSVDNGPQRGPSLV